VNGTLYGTTDYGGTYGDGTIFSELWGVDRGPPKIASVSWAVAAKFTVLSGPVMPQIECLQ